MGLKSDKWIKDKSINKEMIKPFCEGLVGKGVVSYGLSSYGYDIRVSDEFKIFTNINAEVVDPKNFSENNVVDFKGDVCVVPPNSFALARTIEYFKMPDDVLAICLGKSTYARCFTGDTRVSLVDGTAPTFLELVERYKNGEKIFYGYGYKDGEYVAQEMTAPRFIDVDDTICVELDNGEIIECTPDHEFILRDGNRCEAKNLTVGESLLPLYRHDSHGYETVYNPISRTWKATHKLVQELIEKKNNKQTTLHAHHKNHNIRNNHPDNLKYLTSKEHTILHNKEKDLSAQAKKYWSDPKRKKLHLEKLHSVEAKLKSVLSRLKFNASKIGKVVNRNKAIKAWKNSSKERRIMQAKIAKEINIRRDITAEKVKNALYTIGTIRGAAKFLGVDRSVFRRFSNILNEFKVAEFNNHKVKAIKKGSKDVPVYCLTADTGVFALDSGVVVSNCGIIVNVTPFEPGFEGHITIEISNTTPLPAKIYANEGIAQVLFLQGDEPCETTYKDRKGKYQNQEGITLPRILEN